MTTETTPKQVRNAPPHYIVPVHDDGTVDWRGMIEEDDERGDLIPRWSWMKIKIEVTNEYA